MHQVLDPLKAQLRLRTVGSKQTTAIIPIRVDEGSDYRLSRLDFVRQDPTAQLHVDVLVVDDGSPPRFASAIADVCKQSGYRYERLATDNKLFSIARSRNHGARIATTPFIFFLDVDKIPPPGFFAKLNEEIAVRKLTERSEDMIMVPDAYLTETATEDYLINDGANRFAEFLDRIIDRDPIFLEKVSTGTSSCLYSRLYYLARGGNVEDFSGWGFEDIEFNLRVARLTKAFPIPPDFALDKSTFDAQWEYRGWKSFYRLFGDRSFLKGLLLFHAWHPVDHNISYYRQRSTNEAIFKGRVADFVSKGIEPEPLSCASSGRSLVLKKTPFTYARLLRPMLGETLVVGPDALPGTDLLGEMLAARGIDRIVFHNPYASPEVQHVYEWARRTKFPFIVCERGALNGSILFDTTGFLADSTLFNEEHWSLPLKTDEDRRLDEFIVSMTSTSETLEAQGSRMAPAELREKVGVTTADHVVLVCLQRPGDSATRFFPGPIGAYGDFIWTIEKISRTLPHNVQLLFKVHPLEDDAPDIQGINVSQYHINDLMGIANTVVTFTSGTGVVSMLWNLPVIVCGNAFYGNDKLVNRPSNVEELRDMMCTPLSIDETVRRQFLHYLCFSYYSFGSFETRPVRLPDGSRMTATTDIKFDVIRGFGRHGELRFANRTTPKDSWRSMLFDRYMGTKQGASLKTTGASPKTAGAPPRAGVRWGIGKRIVHRTALESIGRIQGYESRQRMKHNPIDFYKKAKWPPNRLFGRLLLDKSQRPY